MLHYHVKRYVWARWMRRQLHLSNVLGVTSRDHTESSELCRLIENLVACRDAFDTIKDSLHRDLMEYIWNPERLATKDISRIPKF